MSTKRLLGGLGQGMMQLGATYGQTSLANLEADAQRMKEERLATMQMAQFGVQSQKDIYQMEMGEKKFALLEDEAARKAEESEYQKSLRGKGTWEWKEIEDKGWYEPGANQLEEGKWIKGPKRYAWVNSVTGEVKYVEGSKGAGTGAGTGRKMYSGPFDAWYDAYVKGAEDAGKTPISREDARKQAEAKGVVFTDKGSNNNGKTPPPPPKVDPLTKLTGPELNEMYQTSGAGGDMGEVWYTNQLIPGLGEKIVKGSVEAAKFVTDRKVMAANLGLPVDVITWAINQFLPESVVIEKPIMGSAYFNDWLLALAPHYEKGKQLTKDQLLKIVPSIDLGQGSLDATYQGDRDEKVLDAIDRWNQFSDIEKASRLKKWGGVDKATDKTLKGSSVAAKIAQFIGEPVESIASALEGLPSKAEIIEIVEGWPTPDKVDPKDVPTIKSVIDAIKAQIEKVIPLDADAAKDTLKDFGKSVTEGPITDYWKDQIGSVTEGLPVGEQVLPSLTKPVPSPYPNVVESGESQGQNGLILNPVPSVPTVLPPEVLPGEMPTGSLTDGPLDEVIISQMPYDSLVTLFNNAQEMVSVGVGEEEAEILFTNMELIKSELRTREPPAATELPPELPPELPVGFGQDDPRIDDGQSLLDTKVALDPTQRSRRWDTSRGRQGEGGLSMDADYRTLPGTLSRKHGQDDPQDAGTMNRAEIKALLDPTQRHRQEVEVETDIFKMSYDRSIEIIRGLVSNLVESGMSNNDVIDQLFRIVEEASKSDEKKFNKSDYKKALHNIIIGLHTQNK